MNSSTLPILVHVHIYYKEMWQQLSQKLSNITRPYELYVTMNNPTPEMKDAILQFRSDAKIIEVENLGFDVWPFVHVINQVDLSRYSYVLKLHTKRNVAKRKVSVKGALNGFDVQGVRWRNYLLSFLLTKETFERNLRKLEQCADIGMLCDYRVILKEELRKSKLDKQFSSFLASKGMKRTKFRFCAGTMFIVRPDILKVLQEWNLSSEDFAPSAAGVAQFAHVAERLLGFLVYSKSCKIDHCCSAKRLKIYKMQNLAYRFKCVGWYFYENYVNQGGKHRIKILRIPVWRFPNKPPFES